uniref:Myosin motor domain-containing protein n=1 Tax=Cyprinus carpio TaxID=7962 RepID=A0A8C1GU29_CYPCA
MLLPSEHFSCDRVSGLFVCVEFMTGAPVFLICEQIKEEKKPPAAATTATQPPPPLSAVPGGFLKQLVRETEKETRHKEPELKEEKTVRSHFTGWDSDGKTFFRITFFVTRDVWYEAGKVWYAHKDGYTLATQLKPDEGTPELPDGRVRVRLDSDGSVHDVSQYEIEKLNPPELDLCEDLSDLVSVNESSVLHTLTSRAKGHLPLTHAGPNLLALWPPLCSPGKVRSWEAPGPLQALVRRVYVSMVGQRRDQTLVALGRSGTGKTTSCQSFSQELLKQAGTAGGIERLQAVFTVLRSFGCVSSSHSEASTRFAMVLSLDFNHAGLAAAAHLQTMLLEKWRVCQRPEGESNFLVFSQMLAGLSTDMRTQLQLHQLKEHNSFGISCPTKVDEKQRASVGFGKLLAAMNTLGFSSDEQKAIWHVLAGIYHLGVAGTCKVGRKQFMSFDSAQTASAILGCEGEELHTAVFKHHLRQLLQRATGGVRDVCVSGPRLSAAQCVEGMAAGLYEELFTSIVSLINRALHSQQLTLASVMVVDTPGLRNPRHSGDDRAAGFSELCHNYLQERLLEHYFSHTFTHTLERYTQEGVAVGFTAPETSPSEVVCAVDQPGVQVRGPEGDSRGLLWVLDEEMVTPGSTESTVLERMFPQVSSFLLACSSVRQCEQPLQCEIAHLMGSDPVRYDLSGWFGQVQNNPSVLNASSLLQNSSIGRVSVPPLCRGLGGVEGGSQRSLERCGTVRKTLSSGMAALRRHSQCIAVKLQQDALVNLIRRARPVFLQCLSVKTDGCGFDVPALRVQLHSTHLLPALQLYRTGFPEHMSLGDFRCRFQALSAPIMKRYGSVFITPDERKVFMKRGVLRSLDQQRNQLLSGWLVQLQASSLGHLCRQKYRRMKVSLFLSCIQRNVRVLTAVAHWSWWKLLCRVRPLLDVNMDDQRELQLQLECAQTEVEFLRRRLRQSEERLEGEKEARQLLDTKVQELQSQLDQSKRSVTDLKRHCRRLTSDLQDARVLTDSLQGRAHELERKQRRSVSLTCNSLIFSAMPTGCLNMHSQALCLESQVEVTHLQQQKEELCAQIRDLSVPLHLTSDSIPELKKKLRDLETREKERSEEISQMTARIKQQEQMHLRFEMEMERMKQIHQKELEDKDEELEDVQKSSQRRLRQLEMQLEQEYEEKQMVVHEKHDLEGLIATLCEQVGHRDFDVEKRLRRDLKRTHVLLSDAQLLLSTVEQPGQGHDPGAKEQLERLRSRRLESECAQKTLAAELENAQIELESICKQKSLVDEQLAQLRYERTDLMKRLEEDQEDLNELMKKHKALIAQSSSDISQIRELQAEMEELKKQRQTLQEELQTSVARVQFLESSTVARSIVSKQEARICDLENKLEFQRGQVKRFEVLVLRLRDSVVRLGEELEQAAQAEARERENSRYYQQRLADMKLEMDDLSVREQESSRRRMELEMQVEELSAVRQTLQADLETSIRRIVDLQAALEEEESSDESDTERSCTQDLNEDIKESSSGLGRASSSTALSELLEGLRKKRAGWERGSEAGEGSTVSLPIYQTTGASTLRRRSSALSLEAEEGLEDLPRPGILKPPSPHLPRASSLRSLSESGPTSSTTTNTTGKMNRFSSCDSLASVTSTASSRRHLSNLAIPEEGEEEPSSKAMPPLGTYQPVQRRLLGGLVAETGESQLGSEPLVFQNRRLVGNQDKERSEVDAGDTSSDILPAIRRAQSTSSLASSSSRTGQRRALSVHFGELPPSRASRRESDSDSSSSGGSQKRRGPQGERLEAEGSEDVNSVMKKYLKKAEVD